MAHASYHVGKSGKATNAETTKQSAHTYRKEEKRNKPHSNKDINPNHTKYNVEKTKNNKPIDELIDERMLNFKGRGKANKPMKNQVVTREAISQLNKEYFHGMSIEEKQETAVKFSDDALEWYQEEFGEENVLGYSAHLDETNPHTHFTIIPMTEDGRLSQKDFWKAPSDLKRQHREFREHLVSKGWDIELENVNQGKFIDFEADIYKENASEINRVRNEVNEEITTLKDTDVNQEAYNQVIAEGKESNNRVVDKLNAFNDDLSERDINVSKREENVSNRELKTNRDMNDLETNRLAHNDKIAHHNQAIEEFNEKNEEQKRKDRELKDKEIELNKKAARQDNQEIVTKTVTNAMLKGDDRFKPFLDRINSKGLNDIKPSGLQTALSYRLEDIRDGKVSQYSVRGKDYVDKEVTRNLAEAEDDGPDL